MIATTAKMEVLDLSVLRKKNVRGQNERGRHSPRRSCAIHSPVIPTSHVVTLHDAGSPPTLASAAFFVAGLSDDPADTDDF